MNYVTCNRRRGYISETDEGSNKNYYIVNNAWYRMFSSYCFGSDKYSQVFHINDDGYIGHTWVSSEAGGVQDFHYLFFFVYERFFHDTIKESLIDMNPVSWTK